MKKLIVVLTALIFAVTLNAQVYIGGSFSIETGNINSKYMCYSEMNIAPSLGYSIDDSNSVEVSLSYIRSSVKYDNIDLKEISNEYYVSSSYGYCIPINEDISYNLYCGLGVGFDDFGLTSYGVFTGNYIEYTLTSHWSICYGFDFLSVSREKCDDIYDTVFDFCWNDPGIDVGFYYYF